MGITETSNMYTTPFISEGKVGVKYIETNRITSQLSRTAERSLRFIDNKLRDRYRWEMLCIIWVSVIILWVLGFGL